jgi:RHS repeat-associated protein
MTSTTHVNGTITDIEYNSHGKAFRETIRSITGAPVKEERYYYGITGQLTETTATVIANNEVLAERTVRMKYDRQEKLLELQDGAGSPEQKTTTYFYNILGQKTCELQPNGNELHFSYDALGRMASLASNDQTIDYHYGYDVRDNVIEVNDRVQGTTTERTYDLANRMVSERLSNGLSLQYDYDTAGRLTTLTLPDETVVSYSYRGKFLHSVSNGTFTHIYEERNLSGKVIRESTIFNGERVTTYSPLGQMLSIQNGDFSDTIVSRDISGNATHRILQGKESRYRWDDLHQLAEENSHDYMHDSQYNRRLKDGKSCTINALNQVLHDGIDHYSYDKNGNLIEGRGYRFEYDALNRLIAIHTATETVRYAYDYENRRISSTSDGGTLFIYVGMNEIGSISPSRKCVKILGDGTERSAGVLFEIDGCTFEPVYDLTGNVAALRNESGTVESYEYDLFGIPTTENPISPWGFSSKRRDLETGFIYFGHRYYDPTLGRWLTMDPKGYAAGPNLYAYIKNNPVKYFDEYGLEAERAERLNRPKKPMTIGQKRITKTSNTKRFTNNTQADTIASAPKNRSIVIYSLGLEKEPEHYFISFTNGICNTLEDAKESAMAISKLSNNYNVYIIHTHTHGALHDIACAGLQIIGVYDEHCLSTEGQLRALHDKFPGKHHLSYVHSRGALTFDRAVKRLPKQLQNMTHVRSFGGAHFIDQEDLSSAQNYMSDRDIVPYICNPFALVSHAFRKKDHIKVIDGQGFFGLDHSFSSPTYQRFVEVESMNFDINIGGL